MITISALEYTIFAPAQLLRNWRPQRPSYKCASGSSFTRGDMDGQLRGNKHVSDYILAPQYMIIFVLHLNSACN
jgi:hypothetical protein